MTLSRTLVAALAPTGPLRASINLGNKLLARMGEDGKPAGVTIDLAGRLASELGVELVLLTFDGAAKSVEAVRTEHADVGFFAIDPARGDGIHFTDPYGLIDGAYLVHQDSPIQSNDDVDRDGQRVVVGKGSAYDLFLSRALAHAEIVRVDRSDLVVDAFLAQQYEVAAGIRAQLAADTQRRDGLRLLPGRFMSIQQAMGLAKGRGDAAAAYLTDFVKQAVASGFVAESLHRHGVRDVEVASGL